MKHPIEIGIMKVRRQFVPHLKPGEIRWFIMPEQFRKLLRKPDGPAGEAAPDPPAAKPKPRPAAKRSDYLTVRRAAEIFSVHPRTIRRRVEDGRLAGFKVGGCLRIPRAAVDEVVEVELWRYAIEHGLRPKME